jgi:hypothetical protein
MQSAICICTKKINFISYFACLKQINPMKQLLILSLLVLSSSTLHAQTITTIAGNGTSGYSGDGKAATAAQLGSVTGVAADAKGNVYILDGGNRNIRKVSAAGIISTIGGKEIVSHGFGSSGDGGSATAAELKNISSIAVDAHGNVYLGDTYNCVVRKIKTTGIINTFAGSFSTLGDYGDGCSATAANLGGVFGGIGGVAIDAAGNVIFADAGAGKIRKVNTAGKISTIAGTGISGYSGDGGKATQAKLNHPHGVAIDSKGNIYFADVLNNRIRKISTSGIISTIAGTGISGFSGDGHEATAAQVRMPDDVAVDKEGNVLIADNNRIRKVSTSGIITTIAGGDNPGFTGDGGNAVKAGFDRAGSVALDAAGNVYIADGNRVRKITYTPAKSGSK